MIKDYDLWDYEGDQENGFPHGFGKRIYTGLRLTYIGHWEKGRKSGKGILQYADQTFEITFKNGKPKTLHSFYDNSIEFITCPFEDVEIDGNYIENLSHSIDIYFAHKSKFSSELDQKIYSIKRDEFKNMIYKGNLYFGSWTDCPNGFGIYQSNDYEYRGYFKNGIFHGRGTYVTIKKLFKGEFENGKLIGYAQEVNYDKGIIFKGNYKGFEKNGKFKVIIGNYVLKTAFCNNVPNDTGKIFINNSILYNGHIDKEDFFPKNKNEKTLIIIRDFFEIYKDASIKMISKIRSYIENTIHFYPKKLHLNRFKFPKSSSWIDYEIDKNKRSIENKENEAKKLIFFNNEYFKGISKDDGTSYGIYKYTQTDWYCGEMKSWKKHGIGKMFANGSIFYNGKWEDDKFHGKGTLFYEGMKIIGNWNKGKLDCAFKVILIDI